MNAIVKPDPEHGAALVLRGSPGFSAPAARIADLPGPPGLPLLGNALQLKPHDLHQTLENWAHEYGPMFRFSFAGVDAVCVADPVLMNEILRQRPKGFTRSRRLSTLIDELGFKGVFSAEGEAWKRQRKLVMRALTPEAVKHFFPIIETVTQRLEAKWRTAAAQGAAVDVPHDLKCYSIDVTTWLSMGVDVDTLTQADNPLQSDVEYWFATIGRRLAALVPYWRYVKLPADRRTDATLQRLEAAVVAFIGEARARLATDPGLRARPRNILEALVAARDEPGSEFTDADVRGNVATMLFAGEDTTANAMSWLLYHLAGESEVAARVAAEADALLGAATRVEQFAQFDQLAYLEASAVESMRLKPIAPLQGVSTTQPMDIAGLQVPAGQLIFLMSRVVATSEAHFAEPLRFRPERWLDEGENQGDRVDDTRRKIFPFGGGPRYCPGRYLAMVEIKAVVAMALRNFELQLAVHPADIRERLNFTMGPESLPLRFVPRRGRSVAP